MASDSMFVEPEITIKEETTPSAYDEDCFSDTSSEVPLGTSDGSAPTTTPQVDRADSMAYRCTREGQSTDREDVKIRLVSKNKEILHAKSILSKFPKWLEKSEELIPEVGDWIEAIKAIFEHSDHPRVVLGFMGQSGCGKSSVINALLDEEELLPCNCMEACTAVAVEIAWNTSNDKAEAYKCVVQFITVEEWKGELENLIADILSLEPGARSNPLANDENVSAAKIKAVYPNLDLNSLMPESAAELLNDDVVSKILGQQKVIGAAAGESKKFASEIKPYIDSSSSATNSRAKIPKKVPYWPLVKVVNIYAKSRVLSSGLIIVDLPGSGDSNAARAVIAEQYMQSVEAICIVADIRRALTNSVARNLFGRGDMLKRRLLRNGLLDEERTFFVLTCTDIINNRQVIGTQGLQDNAEITEILHTQQTKTSRKEEVSQRLNILKGRKEKRLPIIKELAKNVRTLQPARKESGFQARKRKRAELDGEDDIEAGESVEPKADSDLARIRTELEKKKKAQQACDKEIEALLSEETSLWKELAKLEHQLTAICIQKRNSHVIHRMGIDFSLGLSELERDLNDEGDEAASSVPKPKPTLCRNGANTFCVCAKAFQKLRGRFNEDQTPSGFDNLDNTSIPQLAEHCVEFTLNAQERLADRFLDDFGRLRIRMRQWADNTMPDRQVTMKQKQKLKEKFKEHKKVLQQAVLEFIDFIDVRISSNIAGLKRRSLGVAVKIPIQKTPEIFGIWADQVPSGMTWKAICRKDGVHKSRSRGEGPVVHNWNEDLADGLIKILDRNLNQLFNEVLPDIQRSHTASMEGILKNFPRALAASCLLINKHIANPLQNLLHTLSRHEAEMQRAISNRFGLAITMGRIADQKVPLTIRRAMKPGYTAAATTKGKGSVQAVKDAVETHLEQVKSSMYLGAANDVAEAVENTILMLKGNLQKDLDSKLSRIESDFEKMLATATTTPRPETGPWKIKLQAEVLEKLTAFDNVLGEFQSADEGNVIDEDPYHQADMNRESSEDRPDYDDNEQNEGLDAMTSDIPNIKGEYATFSDEED